MCLTMHVNEGMLESIALGGHDLLLYLDYGVHLKDKHLRIDADTCRHMQTYADTFK